MEQMPFITLAHCRAAALRPAHASSPILESFSSTAWLGGSDRYRGLAALAACRTVACGCGGFAADSGACTDGVTMKVAAVH